MKTENQILLEIDHNEKALNLYDFKFLGISVWRLVRFSVRVGKLKQEINYINRTSTTKFNFFSLIASYFTSFIRFLSILISNKKYNFLILAFPRLVKYNEEYMDKYTDPLIEKSNLKNRSIVLQRNLSGNQFSPRYNSGAEYASSDFIDYTSNILGLLISPFLYLFFFNKINNLNKKAKEYFNLSSKFSFIIALRMGVFLNKCLFAYITLKFLRINKVILVNRVVFLPFIAVAKKNNIKVLELQHGITHSETDLYMGEYQYEIDPDYFLNFGSIWVGNQFSISKEKQVVIGWAYKDWLLSRINVGLIPKSVLVVSSPSITSRILKSTIELATEFKNYNFILRLHPQEKLDSTQIKELENYINIIIDDNIQDSLFSILKCQFIIGENSSVLYEAISLAKPVAKIMFNGLKSKNILDNNIETIQYLFEVADFSCFISNSLVKSKYLNGIYDTFDVCKFNNLLK